MPAGNSLSNLDIYNDTVRVSGAAGVSNSNLGAAYGGISNANILYSVSGAALTLNSGVGLITTLNTPYVIDGDITASGGGALTFNGPVTLAATATVGGAGSGAVTFNSTIDGANALTLAGGGGNILNGVVGGATALTSLSLQGGATDQINTMAITTSGDQTYSNALTLSANTILTANGNISFANGISGVGGNTLTLQGSGANDNIFTIKGNLTNLGVITINGGSGFNTLVGQDMANAWHITGSNAGDINGAGVINFTQMQNLIGGLNDNTFTFAEPGGYLAGSVSGMGSGNVVNVVASGYYSYSPADLIGGTFTGISQFSNLQHLAPPAPPAPPPEAPVTSASIQSAIQGSVSQALSFTFTGALLNQLSAAPVSAQAPGADAATGVDAATSSADEQSGEQTIGGGTVQELQLQQSAQNSAMVNVTVQSIAKTAGDFSVAAANERTFSVCGR
jgi:hypothetical protein